MTAYAWCPNCGREFTTDAELPCARLAYMVAACLRAHAREAA